MQGLVVREDIRDLSRLPGLGRIEMFNALLLDRIGSFFSLASAGRDLGASIPTVKRWRGGSLELFRAARVCGPTRPPGEHTRLLGGPLFTTRVQVRVRLGEPRTRAANRRDACG